MPDDNEMARGFMTPIPDPTALTTQQLQREITTTRELVERIIEGQVNALITRLDGNDRAIVLLQASTDKDVKASIIRIQEVYDEKFASIQTQFRERDTRTEKTSTDAKTAVDAALQAAKEAVGAQDRSNTLAFAKSEAGFAKQIEQQGTLLSSMQKSNDEKIDDTKSRISTLESRLNSIEGQKKGGGEAWGVLAAVIGVIVGIGGVVIAAIMLMRH